jgi:hypothetical protein
VASSLRELNLDPFGQQPQRIPIYRDEPEFVDRVRNNQNYPVINNPDGSVSTHRMAAESDANGNWYVFPTIQMQDGELVEYYDSRDAMDAAFKTGNILRAPNKQSALNYAEGAYKRGTGLGNKPTTALMDIEEFSRLSPSDPLYIHQDPMPVGADIMTQQEAISELSNRESAASVAGTVSPFESSWKPWNPNFRATAQNAISNMLGGSNISSSDNYLGGRVANTLTSLLDFTPVVGDAVGVGDAMTSYRQGDMLGTGINALATGVGVLPLVGGPASKAVKAGGNRVRSALRGIDAWHGSPYEFENFSIDNIGTGAGLQAYGDGLYFAGNPKRAIAYSNLLPDTKVDQSLIPAVFNFFENDYSLSKARAGMKSAYPNATNTELDNALNEYYMHLDDQGYMYNVNLNVEPENLLDFDAPLSQQPEAVKRAAEFYNVKTSPSGMKEARGSDVYRAISQARQQPPFDSSSMNTGGPEASAYLNELGIKGIKYKAGTGEGANNYVMFDDSLIDTKRVNDKLTDSWMNPEARMARAQDLGYDMDNVFYHGTNKTFEEFDASLGQGARKDTGVFVSNSPDVASSYAGGTSAQVLPLRVRLQNPMKVYADGSNWSKLGPNTRVDLPRRVVNQSEDADLLEELGFDRGSNTRTEPMGTYTLGELFPDRFGGIKDAKLAELFDKDSYLPMTTNDVSRWAKKQGVDGVIFEDISDRGSRGFFDNDKASMPSRNAIIFDPKDIRSVNAEFDPTKADSADLLSSISPTQSSLRNIA